LHRKPGRKHPQSGSVGYYQSGACFIPGHWSPGLHESLPAFDMAGIARTVIIIPGIVLKIRHWLTFLATIEHDFVAMKTLAVISILALLTITGAAYTDQLFTSDQSTAHRAN
jgi:hypothetical protein